MSLCSQRHQNEEASVRMIGLLVEVLLRENPLGENPTLSWPNVYPSRRELFSVIPNYLYQHYLCFKMFFDY